MRPILLLTLICLMATAYSADNETIAKKKVIHHLQFLIGNYVGESVMYKPITGQKAVFTPMYCYAVGFEYKVEFSGRFGLRTGINYFTDGASVTSKEIFYNLGGYPTPTRTDIYKSTTFSSSIFIPIHFIYYKPLQKGRLILEAGPDIYFPTNTFGKEYYGVSGDNTVNENIRSHTDPSYFLSNGMLGFSFGVGYEKKLSDKLSIELMPDFRLMNAVPFNFNRGVLSNEQVPAYTAYPFNMALGLSTYITFY